MKFCKRCENDKEITEFYAHPAMADGYLNICKPCKKEESKERYDRLSNDPEWVESERERNLEKYYRLYATGYVFKAPPGSEAEKQFARRCVAQAVKAGVLVRPEHCPRCGKKKRRIEAHHHDYSKPLEVEWLCSPCHKEEHLVYVGNEDPEEEATDEESLLRTEGPERSGDGQE